MVTYTLQSWLIHRTWLTFSLRLEVHLPQTLHAIINNTAPTHRVHQSLSRRVLGGGLSARVLVLCRKMLFRADVATRIIVVLKSIVGEHRGKFPVISRYNLITRVLYELSILICRGSSRIWLICKG